jgi:hypothetical protein
LACINGWFACNAKIKAKLLKFVLVFPCSQAMSPIPNRHSPFYAQTPAPIVTRITVRGESHLPDRAGLGSGLQSRVRCVITHGGI